MSVYEKLLTVQKKLNAPKSKFNRFGGYNYRSCEDILEGTKGLLDEVNATLILSDEIVQIADRIYIKATATFIDVESGEKVENTAYAREPLAVKGMSDPQITGSSSTYARKYCLNGLFCIDDTVDDDTEELKNEKDNRQKTQKKAEPKSDETLNKEMAESVNPNLVPHGDMIDAGQIAMMQSEMKRTGVTLQQILSMAKVETIDKMNQPTAIAILNKLGVTKSIQG